MKEKETIVSVENGVAKLEAAAFAAVIMDAIHGHPPDFERDLAGLFHEFVRENPDSTSAIFVIQIANAVLAYTQHCFENAEKIQ